MEKPTINNIIVLSVLFLITILLFIFLPLGYAILTTLLLLFPIYIFFILRFFMKSTGWKIFATIIVYIILIIIFSIYMFFSIKGFVEDFSKGPITLALEKDNEILFLAQPQSGSNKPYLVIEKNTNIEKNLITIDYKFFDAPSKVIIGESNIEIDSDDIKKILDSENPKSTVENIIKSKISLPVDLESLGMKDFSNDDLRIASAAILGIETIKKNGAGYVLDSYNNGLIKTKPNPLSIKIVISLIPEGLLEDFVQKQISSQNLDINNIPTSKV